MKTLLEVDVCEHVPGDLQMQAFLALPAGGLMPEGNAVSFKCLCGYDCAVRTVTEAEVARRRVSYKLIGRAQQYARIAAEFFETSAHSYETGPKAGEPRDTIHVMPDYEKEHAEDRRREHLALNDVRRYGKLAAALRETGGGA